VLTVITGTIALEINQSECLCLSTSIVTEKYRIIICLYVIHHEREGKKEQEREIEKSIACHELQEINIYSRIKFYNESNDKLEANRICI
jgi:hypothetical protein